jgi:hypothetical protein
MTIDYTAPYVERYKGKGEGRNYELDYLIWSRVTGKCGVQARGGFLEAFQDNWRISHRCSGGANASHFTTCQELEAELVSKAKQWQYQNLSALPNQVGSTPTSQSGGRRFNSLPARQISTPSSFHTVYYN